jgi:hypothetical protein
MALGQWGAQVVLSPDAWITSTSEIVDREDADYYYPPTLALEAQLRRLGAQRLDAVATLRDQAPNFDGAEFLYVDIASVDRKTGLVHPEVIATDEAPSRAKRVAMPGDILVALVRPARNVIGVIDQEVGRVVCSTGFAVLNVPQSPWALFAFLKTQFFVSQAVRRATASMYPALSEADLCSTLIPPLAKQFSVAAAFESAFTLHRQATNAQLAALSLGEASFERLLEVPNV